MDKPVVIQENPIAINTEAAKTHLHCYCSRSKKSPFAMARIASQAFCLNFINKNKPKPLVFTLAGPARKGSV
jgi:hypothetical protein